MNAFGEDGGEQHKWWHFGAIIDEGYSNSGEHGDDKEDVLCRVNVWAR